MATDFSFAVGRDRTNLATSSEVLTFLNALTSQRRRGRCLVDAALQVHRVHAGGYSLQAFANDRLGQNRSSGCAVTGYVVGLGSNFRTICAPMFSNLSSSSISLATETPSLVMRGAPKDLSRRRYGLWGRGSPLTALASVIDAVQHAGACFGSEFYVFSCHVDLLLLLRLRNECRKVRMAESD